jgi:hypothetical protein
MTDRRLLAARQLWLGEPPLWREVTRCHALCREIADRHYSRQTPGAREFMANGETLVLLHESEAGVAVWGVIHNLDPAGGIRWRCSIYRNESSLRSSDMIIEATSITYDHWRRRSWPSVPLQTEVDPSKVRRKRDPGRCFRRAGWSVVGERRGLVVLEAPAP